GVDDLISADTEDGGAEDALAFRANQHLHETLRFAPFACTPDRFHGEGGGERRHAGGANLVLGHAGAAERRIDEEAIGEDAVGDAAVAAIEQIGGDDLVIIVRGMGESTAAIDIAHGPDLGHIRPELIIHLDEAAFVGLDAGRLEAEIIGIWPSAYCQEQMAADDARWTIRAFHADRNAVAGAAHLDASGIQMDIDVFVLQDLAHRIGYVFVLA